jgi:predicted DCC family thiol-disulfide oxidoreductase YuxK
LTVLNIKNLTSGGVITNNHCDLCTDIRRYLIQRDDAAFPELAPEGFYLG